MTRPSPKKPYVRPELWRIRSCTVMARLGATSSRVDLPSGAAFSSPTFTSLKAGMYLATGSLNASLPCSNSIMAATVVMGFDIE